jgi:uncharacterized coiled-coil protein SlyX
MQSATNGKERRDGSHVYPGCRREQAEQPNRRDGGTLTIRVAHRRVRDAKESRGRHKVAAEAASSRCADLESRIAALESRATAAEARVEELSRDIAQREQCTASRALRQRLLILVKEFHPDRTTSTTPTLVTARLTSLIELLDSALYRR